MTVALSLVVMAQLGLPEQPAQGEMTRGFKHSAGPHSDNSCESCHDLNDIHRVNVSSACGACHASSRALAPTQLSSALGSNIKFNHRDHAEAGFECLHCHQQPDDKTEARAQACEQCHQTHATTARCDQCHITGVNGRLKTQFGHNKLMPNQDNFAFINHDKNFMRQHGHAARIQRQLCDSCHTPDTCATCHLLDARRAAHPADFLRTHSLEAKHRINDCNSCHQPTAFCRDCHVRAGLSIEPGVRQFNRTDGRLKFHPAGFSSAPGQTITSAHHAHQARRNLDSCVSCHQPNDCVACHSAQATAPLRISPHPRGFRCGSSVEQRARGCLACHTDKQELLRRCARSGR